MKQNCDIVTFGSLSRQKAIMAYATNTWYVQFGDLRASKKYLRAASTPSVLLRKRMNCHIKHSKRVTKSLKLQANMRPHEAFSVKAKIWENIQIKWLSDFCVHQITFKSAM